MLGKGLGLWALLESAPHLTPHCIGTYSGKGGFHDKHHCQVHYSSKVCGQGLYLTIKHYHIFKYIYFGTLLGLRNHVC